MDDQLKKAWISHNSLLQSAYTKVYSGNKKEKENALQEIRKLFDWPPFQDYILRTPTAAAFSITRYGLDMETERIIKEIDEIARGERILE